MTKDQIETARRVAQSSRLVNIMERVAILELVAFAERMLAYEERMRADAEGNPNPTG